MERKRGISGGGFCRDVFAMWSGVYPVHRPGEDQVSEAKFFHMTLWIKHLSRRTKEEIPNDIKLKAAVSKIVCGAEVGY